MASTLEMSDWLELSSIMLKQLLPSGEPAQYFGQSLTTAAFAALVRRESAKVDHALVAMATATGQLEVESIIRQLDKDTLIALFSRWAQYSQAWRRDLQPHWLPTKSGDVWRAVFLSMASGVAAEAATHQLWPEAFEAPEMRA